MKKISKTLLALFFITVSLTVFLPSSLPAQAQSDTWSQPLLVFESQGQVSRPSLVADQYGQVHAFWTFLPDTSTGIRGRQVFYTRLDLSNIEPVDIFLSSDNYASLSSAGNDKNLFLMWDSSVLIQSSITPALSAREWTSPSSLGTSYPQTGLVVAPDNSVWLGYGDTATNAIFVRRYDPISSQWSSPNFVSNTSNPNTAPDAIRLSISSDGTLHLVWVEYQLPNGWPPLGVYYSHSSDGGQNWAAPSQMAGPGFNQPNVKIGFGQTIYLTWVGMAGVGGKYFSQSTDGGTSWSGAIPLTDPKQGGGSEGPLNMAIDSSGVLHTIFSLNNCVWYMRLDVNGWTDPDCISGGVPSSHTEWPTMTLGLGNQIHVLWWANDRQLWYMSRQLSVPSQSPLPTPTKIIATISPPTSVPTPIPTPTPIPDYGDPIDLAYVTQASNWAIVAGIVPVVILVVLVLFGKRLQR